MKNKSIKKILCAVGLGGVLIFSAAGCGASGKEPVKQEAEQKPEEEKKTAEAEVKMEEETPEETEGFAFADLADYTFSFASGVGGWSTELEIGEDGSFKGWYHDTDMGDTGDGYPGGTCYWCDFSGQFSKPEKVDAYTYSVKVEDLKQEGTAGTEEIRDEVRYICSEPYGMDGAEKVLIYLPGKPVSELPDAYIGWVQYVLEGKDTLPSYGLYNEAQEEGFSGMLYEKYAIDDELQSVVDQSSQLEDQLQKAGTQMEMTEITGKMYKLWDDELNSVWKQLKETLDAQTMEKLTQEERKWIAEKEKAVQEVGVEFEGGSAQPMAMNEKGYEMTRDRVFELADYLRQ